MPNCTTSGYDTVFPTVDGSSWPFYANDSPSCIAWKLAATICVGPPQPYDNYSFYINENWYCDQSGGFTDAVFGTFCPSDGTQYICSTCPGSCNAGGCRYGPFSLRDCSGLETAQAVAPSPSPAPPPTPPAPPTPPTPPGTLYQGLASPVPNCTTSGYDIVVPTIDGGSFPHYANDSLACIAWKLAATICVGPPQMYSGVDDWYCDQSGGFSDAVFGTFCPSVGTQYICSTCPGSCNAGCVHQPLSLRDCSGSETAQPVFPPPPPPEPPPPPPPPPSPPSTSMCPALFDGLVAFTSVVAYQIRVVNLALGNAGQTGVGTTYLQVTCDKQLPGDLVDLPAGLSLNLSCVPSRRRILVYALSFVSLTRGGCQRAGASCPARPRCLAILMTPKSRSATRTA